MNKHLESVFNILLPGLEKAEIDYWVFAGVGIAGCVGSFVRRNKDVDIFVKANDFKKAVLILEELCNKQDNLVFKERGVLKKEHYERPVWEVTDITIKDEIFSIVPAYVEGNAVKLVFGNGVKNCPDTTLEKVERNVSGYRFFTPPCKDIKEIFLYCFRHRNNWKIRDDVRKDAKAIFSSEEFENTFDKN